MRIAAVVFLCAAACVMVACGIPDTDIRTNVETHLALDSATKDTTIAVTVAEGIVHLAGATDTVAAQKRAEEIARSVKGVKDVVNEVTLKNEIVVAKVREAIAADAMVGKIGIDVAADRGVVRLASDQTNREERQRAIAIAAAVEGVKSVEDWMR
jgi:hyperosmotically inducible periplasmic protein